MKKKRIISAYLNNRAKGDIFGEENELFEKIKKNKKSKTLLSNFSTKNKTVDNFSTITDHSNILLQRNGLSDKLMSINDINKEQIKKRIFSSINSENRININNLLNEKNYKNVNGKNKSSKINNNIILNHGKTVYKQNHFNINQHYKNRKFNSTMIRNEKNEAFINKKSTVIKIK